MVTLRETVQKKDVGHDYNNKYWLSRYNVQERNVIAPLSGREGKVFTTGKYLNVVRWVE
ncbi:unnamed protein product [Choristocarpus tenellus]